MASSHRIMILGDSFPNRLRRFISSHESMNSQLNLSKEEIVWYTQGGLTLRKFHDFHEGQVRSLVRAVGPLSAAILCVGSNDMSKISPNDFIDLLMSQTVPLLYSLGCRIICVTKIFWRREGDYTMDLDIKAYNKQVDSLNLKLSKLEFPLTFWNNNSVFKCGKVNNIWHKDGVHFDTVEQLPYARSLRGAVIQCAENLNRYALMQ